MENELDAEYGTLDPALQYELTEEEMAAVEQLTETTAMEAVESGEEEYDAHSDELTDNEAQNWLLWRSQEREVAKCSKFERLPPCYNHNHLHSALVYGTAIKEEDSEKKLVCSDNRYTGVVVEI